MRKGDDARRELLTRAAELFDRNGYDAVSVKDITDSLGWPKSLFYYYCQSKEELVMMAAHARAESVIGAVSAHIAMGAGNCEKLSRALGAMAFWYSGDTKDAARLLKTMYQPGSLPWRVYLRNAILPGICEICNEIISDGVKAYEMYTPYTRAMSCAVLELAADLGEKLASLMLSGEKDAFDRAEEVLTGYRCAIEKLVEAPFGSIEVTDTAFLRDTAREMGVDFGGGVEYEADTCDNGNDVCGVHDDCGNG